MLAPGNENVLLETTPVEEVQWPHKRFIWNLATVKDSGFSIES